MIELTQMIGWLPYVSFIFIFAYTWQQLEDGTDIPSADHINQLQEKKVDLDEVPLLMNILMNSSFGTWSQSDMNKGLGTLNFDAGQTAAPAVGVAVTAASGATGKVIKCIVTSGSWGSNNAAGYMELGACNGRFNDNEVVTYTGGQVTVNEPDSGPGVDLVQNGEFQNGISGWAADNNASLSIVAGGSVGNCILIARNGQANPGASQSDVGGGFDGGKVYKLVVNAKMKEEATVRAYVGSSATFSSRIAGGEWEAPGDWNSPQTFVWRHSSDSHKNLYLRVITDNATDGAYFDEISLYKIVPCCTGNDNLCFDYWQKSTTNFQLYRQHRDTTYTKDGSFYALKVVPSVSSWIRFYFPYGPSHASKPEIRGRTVTIGAWVYASAASHARLMLYSDGYSYSSYHPGTSEWKWLEVTKTITSDPALLFAGITFNQTGNIDGSTIVYISQPMLAFASVIGEGNYQPRQHEMIWLEKKITSNMLNSLIGQSDVAMTDLNIEADSDAMLPKGCKAVYVTSSCKDSGSAGAACVLYLRKNSDQGYQYVNSPEGLGNDRINRISGWQSCDPEGDINYEIVTSGANTFDISQFRYLGVQVTD